MRFDEVIGQEHVKEQLLQMVREDRVPHALMFFGPQGAGKLPLALAFASLLLCQDSESAPCGHCPACHMLAQWAHPDLHFSFPVYKKKTGGATVSDDFLPQWREQLQHNVYFDTETWLEDIKAANQQILLYVHESDSIQKKISVKANQGGRRVVLIWMPEKMKTEMANKLLKTIEEPPSHTYFLLVSYEPEQVLETILSRVQRIQVPPLPDEAIAHALMERKRVNLQEAEEIAHVAQGSYTLALKLLEGKGESHQFFDLFVFLMRSSYARKIMDMKSWSEQMADMGRERQKRFLSYAQDFIRENFIFNFHQPELTFLTKEQAQFSKRFALFVHERNVIPIMEELSLAETDIEQNVNARMVFFDLALRLTILLKQ